MRIVLDTNVLVSGIFFSGPPFQILQAWRDGNVQLVLSPEILEEYRRVSQSLKERFPEVDLSPVLDLIAANSDMVEAPVLSEPVCDDPDDDKFLACALASNTKVIVSGDKHLLKISGHRDIEVVKPGKFITEYLRRT